jgi:hypothetical protein
MYSFRAIPHIYMTHSISILGRQCTGRRDICSSNHITHMYDILISILGGQCDWKQGVLNVVAQLAGSLVGASFLAGMFDCKMYFLILQMVKYISIHGCMFVYIYVQMCTGVYVQMKMRACSTVRNIF